MAEYKPVTKDGEVEDINMVQVEKSTPEIKKEILTLSYINTQLAVIITQIAALQTKKAEFEALKAAVQAEVAKVVLKVLVVEEPEKPK